MSTPQLRLNEWFAPLDLGEFRHNILGRRALVVPPKPELADRLVEAMAIGSLDQLLALRAKVYAWFHKLDGRLAVTLIPAAGARSFYEAGTTLYIRQIPEFGPHQEEVASTFGIPRTAVDCTLFCNRPHAVTRAHFDTADVIVIQLKGRKTWRIASNEFAPLPLRGYTTRSPLAPELRLYADEAPPAEMPEGATTHVLERGSILHVPRGYWHETSSDQDSLSLHIQISSPNRLDIALAALKNELSHDAWWREPAYDLAADAPGGLERVAAVCNSLRESTSRLDPRDIVHPPVDERPHDPNARFVRGGQVSFGIRSMDTRNEIAQVDIVSYQFGKSTVTKLEMSIDFVSACRWINGLSTGTVFGVSDLLRAIPALNETEAKELLYSLERIRLVRRHEEGAHGS